MDAVLILKIWLGHFGI